MGKRTDADICAPYDLIAAQWIEERKILEREKPYFEHFMALAPRGARLLDLGCGAGVVSRVLLDRGFSVTGVDASIAQLRAAAASCPEAEFITADIVTVDLTGRFQDLVAWDSLFHIPRSEHPRIFRKMHAWLDADAPILLSLGGIEDEFTAPMYGVNFFYSSYAPETSLKLLEDSGFNIVRAQIDDASSRGHFTLLCRKLDRS
jgi:cyclopropane fatty-acyl-phospholipid synthase-like methyltransferase